MKYFKEFFRRGFMFGGLGPLVFGIVCLFIDEPLNGFDTFMGIISTYLIAFIHAGTSVYKDIENWSIVKAIGAQLLSIYVVYTVFYLINSWIPFDINVLIIYTVLFVVAYFVIWFIVYIIVKRVTKGMNMKVR